MRARWFDTFCWFEGLIDGQWVTTSMEIRDLFGVGVIYGLLSRCSGQSWLFSLMKGPLCCKCELGLNLKTSKFLQKLFGPLGCPFYSKGAEWSMNLRTSPLGRYEGYLSIKPCSRRLAFLLFIFRTEIQFDSSLIVLFILSIRIFPSFKPRSIWRPASSCEAIAADPFGIPCILLACPSVLHNAPRSRVREKVSMLVEHICSVQEFEWLCIRNPYTLLLSFDTFCRVLEEL